MPRNSSININQTLSGGQIFEILKKNNLPCQLMLRTDGRKLQARPGFYVINLAGESEQGTHWVGCYCSERMAVYFDSFGCPPPLDIVHFIKNAYEDRVIQNRKVCQDLRSTSCGLFVMQFGLALHNREGSEEDAAEGFIKQFGNNKMENERILLNLPITV